MNKLIVLFIFLIGSFPSLQSKVVGNSEVVFSDLVGCFGFADGDGQRIIAEYYPNSPINNGKGDPQSFDIAVGTGEVSAELEFSEYQGETENNTYRDMSYNFDNLSGNIFKKTKGSLIADTSYFVTTNELFQNALIPLIPTLDLSNDSREYYQPVDAEAIEKIEKLKSKRVVKSKLLALTETGAKICLFVFERLGDDMLASLVYMDGDKIICKDYPAVYDENSTWRVDAGDEPGLFQVMFLARSDEGLLLAVTWAAPEGESSYILKEDGNTFAETEFVWGRYWAPM